LVDLRATLNQTETIAGTYPRLAIEVLVSPIEHGLAMAEPGAPRAAVLMDTVERGNATAA
jgi:hypothetical protein